MSDKDRLFWDERGMVNCGAHAPLRGSDTWVFDHWQAITPADTADSIAADVPLRCEVCHGIG